MDNAEYQAYQQWKAHQDQVPAQDGSGIIQNQSQINSISTNGMGFGQIQDIQNMRNSVNRISNDQSSFNAGVRPPAS